MDCLYCILPCLKREREAINTNTENNNKLTDIDKLNNVKLDESHGKKKKYLYESTLIERLELKNTENYAKIIDIYDADTLTCILFFRDVPTIVKIRLSGIDAPEMKPNSGTDNEQIKETALAIIAKIALSKIIYDNNNIVYIKTHGSEKYGRTLADLYLNEKSEISINQILIDLKLADSYQGKTKEKQFTKNYLNIRDSNGIINIYENKDKKFDEIYKFINNLYPIKYKIKI